MTMYMYKVSIIESVDGYSVSSTCLFQNKRDAENFVTISEQKGLTAILNKWQWKTEVED